MDREILDRFIAEVKGRGPVCDMGTGPGEVARYLYDHGLEAVTGIDISPEMVNQARTLSPMIEFREGNMLALDMPDNQWAGITAFYSIIHIPRECVVRALSELKRVLMPGGLLLLTIHIGDNNVHIEEFFGKNVSIDFLFFTPEEMEGYLREAGFERIETTTRQPYPDVEYQGPRAYLFARKPL